MRGGEGRTILFVPNVNVDFPKSTLKVDKTLVVLCGLKLSKSTLTSTKRSQIEYSFLIDCLKHN